MKRSIGPRSKPRRTAPDTMWSNPFVCFLLAAVTLAAYARAWGLGFVSVDDLDYVGNNPHVLAGPTPASIVWAFTTRAMANWHPLTWLSLMLDATVGGSGPRVYHATNLLLHLTNVLLLFLVLRRVTGAAPQSGFVAALFAVHPLHVESVAWIVERKDVLSTLFWILTLAAYARYASRPGAARYAAVAATFALGLLAKPMLVTLPLLLLLLDYWPLGRPWSRTLILEKIPLLGLSAVSSLITLIAQRPAIRIAAAVSVGERLVNALISYVAYLAMMIWPRGLAAFYPYPHGALPLEKAAAAAIFIIGVSIATIVLAREYPWLPVGWFWYLITLVPVIGFVQVGLQARADRYTYVPLIGIFVIVAWGVPRIVEGLAPAEARAPLGPLFLAAPAILVVLALAASTWFQVGYWQNGIELFTHALGVTGENAVAHANLGVLLSDRGQVEQGVTHLREALRISPGMPDPHFNLARLLISQGKVREASLLCIEEQGAWPSDERTLVNLGLLAMVQKKYDEAADRFSEAVRLYPDSVYAHLNLASIRAGQGREQEARAHFAELERIIGPEKARELGRSGMHPTAGGNAR